MPENIIIGIFIFGAILILIAILGGNFNIFGAKIATSIENPFLRLVTFLLGIVLLYISIIKPDSPFPSSCRLLVNDPNPPVNIRETPNGQIIGTLPNGTTLKVKKHLGEWLMIEYEKREAYVYEKLTKEQCN